LTFGQRFQKEIEMQFQFVLFKTKNYIFYQQLQSAAIMYLLVPSASQESPILLANVQVPSREEIFLKKFDWRGDGLTGLYRNHVYRSLVQISIDDQLFRRSFIILKK